METEVLATLDKIEIGATGLTEIVQNVRTILTTLKGTVPLDRDFGLNAIFLDNPGPRAMALASAEIPGAVEQWEPRARVTSVEWVDLDSMDGRLIPRVRIRIE